MPKLKDIDEDVLEVLRRGSMTESGGFKLPDGMLARELYSRCDKVLKGLGGHWHKASKTHVFQLGDVTDQLREMLESGKAVNVKKDLQFFATPHDIALQLAEIADVREGDSVLEPSAGRGAIADAIREYQPNARVVCIDVHEPFITELRGKGYDAGCADILAVVEPDPTFDLVVMNPPFTGDADLAHVQHCYKFLKPGGRLAAIILDLDARGQNKAVEAFKVWMDTPSDKPGLTIGEIAEELERGAFGESGTQVPTMIITVDKPK